MLNKRTKERLINLGYKEERYYFYKYLDNKMIYVNMDDKENFTNITVKSDSTGNKEELVKSFSFTNLIDIENLDIMNDEFKKTLLVEEIIIDILKNVIINNPDIILDEIISYIATQYTPNVSEAFDYKYNNDEIYYKIIETLRENHMYVLEDLTGTYSTGNLYKTYNQILNDVNIFKKAKAKGLTSWTVYNGEPISNEEAEKREAAEMDFIKSWVELNSKTDVERFKSHNDEDDIPW